MRIISASRRTDIPAFYARWFLRRIEAGWCESVNPFNGEPKVVSLRPEETIGIIFWTRHAAPLLGAVQDLLRRGYRLAFQYTINGYPRIIESHNPPAEAAGRVFRQLSEQIPRDRAWWRYDPIVLSEQSPFGWHLDNFQRIARTLRGATERCYISFASIYRKTRRNLSATGLAWREPATAEKLDLAGRLVELGREEGITVYSCCDDQLLEAGALKAHCIDASLFPVPESHPPTRPVPTRPYCGCSESVDIGAYDTCVFGCAYCYATNSRRAGLARWHTHDPEDPALWRPRRGTGEPAESPTAKDA